MKKLKAIIKSFFISFSMYTRIPVPQFEWKEEDMKYVLCFFPWAGAVIGLCIWLWNFLCGENMHGSICHVLVGTAIPLLITGGFHIDGYMDTMDALNSYQQREKKLEILKDSHIGAFAVIMLVAYYMIYMAAYSEIDNKSAVAVFAAGFFLSRTLSGIAAVSFKSAKPKGSLVVMAGGAKKNVVKVVLYIQLFLCVVFMVYMSVWAGILSVIAAMAVFVYYRFKCYKEFGGITGDTAGYFVTICEAAVAVAAAVSCRISFFI